MARRIVIPPIALHDGQRRVLESKKRFKTVAAGRRFGKTLLSIEWLSLMPGGAIDGWPTAFFAPTYKLLLEVWSNMERSLRPITEKSNKSEMRIELITGGKIDFWTLEDEDAGRGRKYKRIVVDEAAHARKLREAWEQAILPTLTDFRGDAWFISTPKGINFFHELYLRGLSNEHPDWDSFQMPTTTNPYISPEEVERFRKENPERVFSQEYMAQFLSDGGGVFRRIADAIDSTLPTEPYTAKSEPGAAYVIGVDWGRHNDFTVFTTIDAKAGAVVSVDRFTNIDYAVQLQRLQALHQRFPKAPILAESNSMGGPLIEQLQRMQLPVRAFHTTSASKSQAIEALALAFENSTLRIPAVQWLVNELLAFDQERLPSGAMRYAAPKGGHDDGVMSLAIAYSGINQTTGYASTPGTRAF